VEGWFGDDLLASHRSARRRRCRAGGRRRSGASPGDADRWGGRGGVRA